MDDNKTWCTTVCCITISVTLFLTLAVLAGVYDDTHTVTKHINIKQPLTR